MYEFAVADQATEFWYEYPTSELVNDGSAASTAAGPPTPITPSTASGAGS